MSGHAIAKAILLSLGALGTVGPAAAQLRPPEPSKAFALFRTGSDPSRHLPPATAGKYPATYYFEGAVIGAGVFATTGALVWYELACNWSDVTSDCRTGPILGAGVVGALFSGTVGGLVGGLFPAPHPRPLRGHAAKTALLGAGAGALWGFGAFSQFCLNGCRSENVVLSISTTVVGALAGLMVGR